MAEKKLTKYRKRHIEFVKNKVAKAVNDYHMIDDGDKVLVAVSGGKDSLVMLEALAAFQKYGVVAYKLEAIHIKVTDVPYAVDRDFLSGYCRSLDIPVHFQDIEAGIATRGKKGACFVCSWHRRKTLFTYAKETGFRNWHWATTWMMLLRPC